MLSTRVFFWWVPSPLLDNPLAVPMTVVWQYTTVTSEGPEYSSSYAEAITADAEGAKAYYLYINDGANRQPLYRMTSKEGRPLAYSANRQRGSRHQAVELLGYVGTAQLEGMVPINLRTALHLPEDSRGQADFKDFESERFYAYPAFGSYNKASDVSSSTSKSTPLDDGDILYSSANYNHVIEINKYAPHIYQWNIENIATGLDIQIVNVGGPPIGDNTIGEGLGRGMQAAFGFQDFNGFEGIDPALNVCMTIHNPTQAGSHSGTFGFFILEDNGASIAGSVITQFLKGSDFLDLTVIPMDFIENPPIGGFSSPKHTPPSPCVSEWHGQPALGDDASGASMWETLRIRQRVDFDFQGREGVHRVTQEFFTPKIITSRAFTPSTSGVINYQTLMFLTNAFDEGYVYDPVNHAAPILMNTFAIPGMSTGNAACVPPQAAQSVTGFQDLWAFSFDEFSIRGISVQRANGCDFCLDTIGHIFPGPPTTEPRFESNRGAVFLKSRLPAAAAADDKFGVGFAAAVLGRGSFTNFGYGSQRSIVCQASEYTDINKNTASYMVMQGLVQLVGPVGGVIAWPSGTFTSVHFVITDTFANFQGHIDFLNTQGLI